LCLFERPLGLGVGEIQLLAWPANPATAAAAEQFESDPAAMAGGASADS